MAALSYGERDEFFLAPMLYGISWYCIEPGLSLCSGQHGMARIPGIRNQADCRAFHQVHVCSSPSRSDVLARHPSARQREASRPLRGMPSGFSTA